MIKKNYKDVHWIHKGTDNIDKVYKGTNLVFEQGYTREQTGVPPITTTYQAIGKNLKDYKVYGNTVQNGTPTPQNPIQPSETGERTGNLFDYKTVYEPYIDSNGNISTTANVLASWNYFAEADVGKTITVSLYVGSISASYIRVQGQIDGSYITGNAINAGSKGYTEITVTPTSTSDRWRIIYGAGTPDVVLNQVMVAVSATRKDYEPYGYKIPVIVGNTTTNIYLDEPLRKIGDYSDYIDFKNSKVIRQLGEVVLNGSETWNKINNAFQTESNTTPNKANVTLNSLSSHFIHHYYSTSITTNIQNGEFGWNSVKNLTVRNDNCNTTNELKTWLQSNNVTVDYVLKIPTEETILLPNIPTINGTTTFEIDTEIQPSNMYIKYKGK